MNTPQRAPVRILLVDDLAANLVALKEMLASPEYTLVTAASGREALRCLLEGDFAVILLDVSMPEMNGFEVAEAVKARDRTRGTPIIFLTALRTDVNSIYRAYSAGGVDYLEKPLDAEIVRAKVAVFVELYRHKRDLTLKNEQIARQAELLRESERREQAYRLAELQRESAIRYRNLAESIPQIVWTARPDGGVEYMNARWSEATGMALADAHEEGWLEAVDTPQREAFLIAWRQCLRDRRPFESECRLRRAAGEPRWYLCRALPEVDRDGTIINWLGTFTDIDEAKRASEERALLLERANRAVEIRDEFLSIASHELKTPLTALRLQLQLLQRRLQMGGADDPRTMIEEKLGLVSGAVRRMTDLIDNLLDVTRVAAGVLELDRKETLLNEAVESVIANLTAGHTPEVRLRSVAPVAGYWDRLRIEQVLTNLVSNALKYGDGKPVEVSIAEEPGWAVVSIRDHGIGIRKDKLGTIFDRFERLVGGRQYPGLGLGLYISREIVQAHGGRIEVESAPDYGSSFTVRLPLARPGVADEPAAGPAEPLSS